MKGGNLRAFLSYYRPHLGLFIFDMSAGVCSATLSILMPVVVYRLIGMLPNGELAPLVYGSILLCLMVVLIVTADYIGIRWGHILGARVETDMRRDLFSHLQRLSFGYFDRTRTGHIMSRMTNDLNLISEIAHHAPEDFLVSTLTFVGSFVVMFYMNPLLALITLIPVPFIMLWGTLYVGKMRAGFRDIRTQVAEINSQVENSIQGIREVKSYNNEFEQNSRFTLVNNAFLFAKERVCALLANFHGGIGFAIQMYSLVFIIGGLLLIHMDKATIAQLLAFMMYSRYVTMPLIKMVNFTEQAQQGAAAFERFREVMLETPEIDDSPDAVDLTEVAGKIAFTNVFFRYPNTGEGEPWVLDGISFGIEPGKSVALVGESGAGKSTLAALIPRFYDVSQGSIAIDGVDVRNIRQQFLHQIVGVVQQTPFMFDASIRENILIGRPGASDEQIMEAARNANIGDFIESLPDGLDTGTGEHGVRLSGGQRQRISLARIFLKDPAVLIFDEATSALDNESETLVREAMERLCRSRTTIIIAHRLSTVKNTDYIYCMRGGKIVEQGTHRELLASNGYYRELYSMHSF